jgi:hypothetical protein
MDLSLHPRQTEAFLSPATEILYGGAAGGGKSHLLRVAALAWCVMLPGLQVYLFRRCVQDLLKNHAEGPTGLLAMLGPWLAQGSARFSQSRSRVEFANGSRLHLCHCQHDKDALKYQGAEMHVLLIDELTHFTEAQYRFLRHRVRLGGLTVPKAHRERFPRIVCSSNPGGPGHNWVKAMFLDPAPAGSVTRTGPQEGGMLRQYLPARLEDNPTLAATDPGYALRLTALGNPALVKAMRYGDWDIVAGGAIDDLWSAKIHVLPPFAVPGSWAVDRSLDWGSSRPFSVGWWAQSDGTEAVLADGSCRAWPPGTLFRVAEYYGWSGKPDQGLRLTAADLARRIKDIEGVFPFAVRPGPADSSIFDTVNGTCLAEDMARLGVAWLRANKSPGSRLLGLEHLRRRLGAGLKTPMEEPGLFVFDTCRHFIRTVPILPRDCRRPDDVDTQAEDHVYDETRYRLLAARPAASSSEFRL